MFPQRLASGAPKSSIQWAQFRTFHFRPTLSRYFCLSCKRRVSTFSSPTLVRVPRRGIATAVKDRRYSEDLLIYDAGDTRTTYVSFWKTVALLQFGTCVVFLTPMLYKNDNQPDKKIRVLQAAGVTILSTFPTLILSFLTAPFVSRVHLQIPPSASHSLPALLAFARNLPPAARLRFQTHRIFPLAKFTSAYLFELRALPPKRFRLANLELPKHEAWKARQQEKGLWWKFKDLLAEPRFKFYVKEGRTYTIRSGVPGVWEEVARQIREQTVKEAAKRQSKASTARGLKSRDSSRQIDASMSEKASASSTKPDLSVRKLNPIKRQTTRPVRKS